MSIKLRLLVLVTLLSLSLAYMIARKQYTLNTGVTIVLETMPVDPRSLFSGDYVILGYKIGRLTLDNIKGDKDFKRHDKIHVVLKSKGHYWEALSAHHLAPTTSADEVLLKGEVQNASSHFWNPETRQTESTANLQVRYGIENYFVPEGEGRKLERPGPEEKVAVQVAVDKFGLAGIKAILINGKQRYIENLW